MMDYMASKTAYREYEERVRALAPALVYDGWIREQRPGWVFRQIRHLGSTVKAGVASLGERMNPGADGPIEALLTRQEHFEERS